MEVSFPVIIVLVVAFLVLGLLFRRFKNNRYLPLIGIAGALFFLIYAFVQRDYMYQSLFFFIIIGYMGVKSLFSRDRR